jgi:hypothetical protein
MTPRTSDVAACCSNASASFFFRSALAARRRSTWVLAFVVFERRPVIRLRLFAPLRAKITSRQVGSAAAATSRPKDSTPICGRLLHCRISIHPMTAKGPSASHRHAPAVPDMSASLQKRTLCSAANYSLFDHLVGMREQRRRHFGARRPRRVCAGARAPQ